MKTASKKLIKELLGKGCMLEYDFYLKFTMEDNIQ